MIDCLYPSWVVHLFYFCVPSLIKALDKEFGVESVWLDSHCLMSLSQDIKPDDDWDEEDYGVRFEMEFDGWSPSLEVLDSREDAYMSDLWSEATNHGRVVIKEFWSKWGELKMSDYSEITIVLRSSSPVVGGEE